MVTWKIFILWRENLSIKSSGTRHNAKLNIPMVSNDIETFKIAAAQEEEKKEEAAYIN